MRSSMRTLAALGCQLFAAFVSACSRGSHPEGSAAPTPTIIGDGGLGLLGAAAVRQRIYRAPPATGTLTTDPVTTRAGSVLLACLARGSWALAPEAPTDNHGNVFSPLGELHSYADWPTSATRLYRAIDPSTGPNHTFSMTWGDIGGTGDEVTISVVEVLGAKTIEATSWIERSRGRLVESAPVTTSGPAVLVAWWWGSGKVRRAGSKHVAAPGDGFTIVPEATALTSLGTDGYVQVAVAYRVVQAAGTYQVTWKTDDEGAQLYLVALR